MLPSILALLFLSFSKQDSDYIVLNTEAHIPATSTSQSDFLFTVDTSQINYPVLQKDYFGFKAAIGYKESQNDYKKKNPFGYMGKYQFGETTLSLIGVYNSTHFMSSPKLQEQAFYAYTARNKWVLRNVIDQYSGDIINGVEVTESGILAAAHLAGPGGIKRYLRTGGQFSVSDAFGTNIQHYLQQFGGYDISLVEANRNAKVKS